MMMMCQIFDILPTVLFGIVDEGSTRKQEQDALLRFYEAAPEHIRKTVDTILERK